MKCIKLHNYNTGEYIFDHVQVNILHRRSQRTQIMDCGNQKSNQINPNHDHSLILKYYP